jgi:hypothetical protein
MAKERAWLGERVYCRSTLSAWVVLGASEEPANVEASVCELQNANLCDIKTNMCDRTESLSGSTTYRFRWRYCWLGFKCVERPHCPLGLAPPHAYAHARQAGQDRRHGHGHGHGHSRQLLGGCGHFRGRRGCNRHARQVWHGRRRGRRWPLRGLPPGSKRGSSAKVGPARGLGFRGGFFLRIRGQGRKGQHGLQRLPAPQRPKRIRVIDFG